MHQMVLNSQKRADQAVETAHLKEQHQKDVARRMGRIAAAMGVVLLVFLGLNMGLTAAVVAVAPLVWRHPVFSARRDRGSTLSRWRESGLPWLRQVGRRMCERIV